MTYRVTRHIDAPPETVWAALTDAGRLASGRYGITGLTGALRDGGRIALKAEVSGSRTFRLLVAIPEPGRRMTWTGGMPFGPFTGRRQFRLSPEGKGTRFEMQETFTGPLSGPISRSIPDLTASFETFAAALDHDSRRMTT